MSDDERRSALEQLSQREGRPIRRLDEIPGSELDRLARYGFTGLWLVGWLDKSPMQIQVERTRTTANETTLLLVPLSSSRSPCAEALPKAALRLAHL